MNLRQSLTSAIMILVAGSPAGARDDFASAGYAGGAAAYLQVPAHAHAAALAGAVTGWRSGVAGLQFNPAVVDGADSAQFSGSYAFLTDQRTFQALDAVSPIGSYAVAALSITNAGVDGIERRDENGMLDEARPYFGDHEFSIAATAGGRLPGNIALAGRLRYLYQKLDDRLAGGASIDLGGTWTPSPMLCVGVSGLNLLSRLWWDRTGCTDQLLPQARIGLGLMLLDSDLLVEADAVGSLGQPTEAMMGVEYTVLNILSMRVGGSSAFTVSPRNWRDPTITGGVGIRYSYFGADYAISIPTDDARGLISHKVSVVFKLPR